MTSKPHSSMSSLALRTLVIEEQKEASGSPTSAPIVSVALANPISNQVTLICDLLCIGLAAGDKLLCEHVEEDLLHNLNNDRKWALQRSPSSPLSKFLKDMTPLF